MFAYLKNKQVLSWALYDWANSAFATTVMAGFFPVFFQKFWSTDVTATETTTRLGYVSAIAGAVIAVLAPVLGAIADRGGTRKKFMLAWTLLGVIATAALYFTAKGEWFAALALFVLAFWITPYLPLIDYHQHVAIAALMQRIFAGGVEERALYEVNLVTYNGGFHLMVALLSYVLSPERAGAAIMSAYPFLYGVAVLALVRAAGRPRW